MNYILLPYVVVINLVSNVTSRLSPRMRTVLTHVTVTITAVLGVLNYARNSIRAALPFSIMGVTIVMMIILLLANIENKISFKKMKANTLFWAGWFVCFLIMLITSLVKEADPRDYMWSVVSLTIIPMFLIVMNDKKDCMRFCVTVATDMTVVSWLYLLANLLMVPFLTNEYIPDYDGIANNPNGNGLICLAFFTSSLFLLVARKDNRLINLLVICMCIVVAWISVSRAAQLAIILELAVALALFFKNRDVFSFDIPLKAVAVGCAIAVVFSYAVYFTLTKIDEMQPEVQAVTSYEEEAAKIYGDEKLLKINDTTSGRLLLWYTYMDRMTLWGNGAVYNETFPEGVLPMDPHNNAIDICYKSGLIACLGYLLWLASAWAFIIRLVFSKKVRFRPEYILTCIAFVGYFTEAMLEVKIYPMNTGIVFLSFITLSPAAFRPVHRHITNVKTM